MIEPLAEQGIIWLEEGAILKQRWVSFPEIDNFNYSITK